MLRSVESRELFTLGDARPVVRGTYHRAYDNSTIQEATCALPSRIGVLFLNGLFANRSSNGDAAVYWASHLAQLGYPSFRIDLPGSGDADGDPPEDWLGYINDGGYAPVVTAAIGEIVRRFELAGIVLAGHCAGAVTTIYAAAGNRQCRGVIVMDPFFHLARVESPTLRRRLNLWARKSRIGSTLSRMFDTAKQLRVTLTQSELPANANVALLRCWKRILSLGVPVLILKAPKRGSSGVKPRLGEFDYYQYLISLAGRASRVTIAVMEGANHSFSNEQGRSEVQQAIGRWLKDNFQLSKAEPQSVGVGSSDEVSDNRTELSHTA